MKFISAIVPVFHERSHPLPPLPPPHHERRFQLLQSQYSSFKPIAIEIERIVPDFQELHTPLSYPTFIPPLTSNFAPGVIVPIPRFPESFRNNF